MITKSRRFSILIALVAVLFLNLQIAEKQGDRPNIVFFYIDDLGWTDLEIYGSDFYETPAIDELASQGFRFTSAYQAAARCVPSRKSLFTGKYHERQEITDSKGVVLEEYTFAEALNDGGYHTFFTGKWHLGSDSTRYPDRQGFDVNMGGCSWGSPSGSEEGGGRYFSPYDCPTLEDGPEGEYLTDRLTQETIDFMTSHQASRPGDPFLACVFHYAVHTPIEAPESYIAPYREKLISMEYELPEKLIDGPGKTNLRHNNPTYAGMIAAVDKSVERIRASLDDLGIADNTIIVFSTDHGGLSTTIKSGSREIPTSNYPLRTGKGWLYEGGIRSPLIVYWPGITKAGTITDELVVSTDIYPTLLEMAGLPGFPEQHLDGESFAPLLRGEQWSRKSPVMWYFPMAKTGTGNPNMAAVRRGDYKLIHYMQQERFELYDIEHDISESRNLVTEKPELTQEMKDLLLTIETETEMPPISNNRIKVEKDEILPEYPVSISEPDYPVLELVKLEKSEEDTTLSFSLKISENNSCVHPVTLKYYYRFEDSFDWTEIEGIGGDHHRLLPGAVENSWDCSGLGGKAMDVKIKVLIDNELYPLEISEEIIEDIHFGPDITIEIPEGRRLREIVSEKYGNNRLLIGCTTGSWAFGEPNGIVMDREFSYVTPENDFKQSVIRRDSSRWNWDHSDAWLQHIIDNKQVLRIHGPISPQCSKWAKNDNRTATELSYELDSFMTAICQRYNNVPNIQYLDVVNETVTRSGEWMGPKQGVDNWENPWTIIGFETDIPSAYENLDSVPKYIIKAFEIAVEHAPDIKLVLNQHGGMEDAMWEKVKDLVLYLRNEMGFRIDALGWQAHIETGWELEDDNISKLEDLIEWSQTNGLEFHVTEFDSWILDNEKHDFEDQANTFQAVVQTLIDKSVNGTIGWNTWHVSDAKGFRIERAPAMFDLLYKAKPAYYAVQSALENGSGGLSVSSGLKPHLLSSGNSELITMFPNPATQIIKLEANEGIRDVSMYDCTGRKVLSVPGINSLRHEIRVASLTEGVYLVEVSFVNDDLPSFLRMQKLN